MTEEEILKEAKERFKLCADWENDARKHFIEDIKFANADSGNGWQWPTEMMRLRTLDQRPALTVNKVHQHNLQILNDARQNKTAIRITPAGDEATYKAAQVFEDVVRHIEYQSSAQDAYDCALESTVNGGWGYWRIQTDYVSPNSFDQEIYIRRIVDPLTVYMDPDIKSKEGSDARYCFIFEDLPKDIFEKKYPRWKDLVGTSPMGFNEEIWANQEHVRIAEYYRRIEKRDVLYWSEETGTVRKSEIGEEVAKQLDKDETVRRRDIVDNEIWWYFIVGEKVVDKRQWAGKFIPVVRVIGTETVIDGKLDRKGHTRNQKDAQRMYNYWTSAAVEFVALQTKSPWTIPLESVSGLETYWRMANKENFAYLPFRAYGDNGQPLPPPQKAAPPQFSQAYMEGMQIASAELQATTGQYDAQLGKPSNERTGIAIQERQRQGDNATYHFVDNLATAIRYTGKILIDLIPKIYDTGRVIQVVAESGEKRQVEIDPQHKAALTEIQQEEDQVRQIFNPSVGRYEVESDVGPEFATKRQEAYNALTQLAAASPLIMQAAGDLVMKAADFPMADELAKRLHNMLPPQALGGPNPEMEQMRLEMAKQQQVIQELSQSLAEEKSKSRIESEQKDIDVYKAETDRMSVASKIDPAVLEPLVKQLVQQALSVNGALQSVDESDQGVIAQ